MTDEQKIKHLYSRAGFGLSPQVFQQKRKLPLEKTIKDLFSEAKKIIPVKTPYHQLPSASEFKGMDKQEKREKLEEARKLVTEVNLNWLRQMIGDESSPFQEKMTLFWHGHFACESKRFDHAARQINTIRQYALGNFKDLVLAVSKDASMIEYLNNQQNRKNSPNENYARELMELFTIGRGNYTEQDVKEAARAFTGWFADKLTGEFEFNERQHDFDSKTFMGKTGNWNGEDIINIILERKETSVFIATKIYRFFVNDKIDNTHIQALADVFYKSNYNIATMMQTLFESPWFYDTKNVGSKIKSPIELIVGMAKVLGLNFGNVQAAIFPQFALGQVLFQPPNVAGWPGGKAWIDNSTLMLRMNLAGVIFQKTEMAVQLKDIPEKEQGNRLQKLEISADITPLLKAFEKNSDGTLGQDLCDYVLQPNFNIKDSFIENYARKTDSNEEKIRAYLMGIMSLPEYQLC